MTLSKEIQNFDLGYPFKEKKECSWTWVWVFFFVGSMVSASPFEVSPSVAFKKAKSKNIPLMMSFFGIWCPPCNLLEETVFESPKFLALAKNFSLLKLDADAKKSWDLKHRYVVGGYPTVIFTTKDGEEIYRIVGYRSPEKFFRVMQMVLSSNTKGLTETCSGDTEWDLFRCAVVCQERKDETCAATSFRKLLSILKAGSPRFLLAQTYLVEIEKDKTKKPILFEKLLQEYPQSPLALSWSLEYLDSVSEWDSEKKTLGLMERVLSHYEKMKTDPSKEELGLPETDLAQMKAEILEKMGKSGEAKKAYLEAASLIDQETKKLGKNAKARGYETEKALCLEKAGKTEEALSHTRRMASRYPEEFTFHYLIGSILERAGKSEESLSHAEKAYQFSYGDNRIRSTTLLVKLLLKLGRKERAEKLVNLSKAEFSPSADLKIRTHRYLKELEDVWKASAEPKS